MNNDIILAEGIITKNGFVCGNHIAIDHGFYCTVDLILDNYIHIGPYCTMIGGKGVFVKMEDYTSMAAGVRFICASLEHLGAGIPIPFLTEEYRDNLTSGNIVVKKFANVLTNAIVFPGVTLGEGSVISAGSIVTRDTDPWLIYAGNPARPVKERPKDKMLELAAKLEAENAE
ncbi:MAG: acyltransferase [Crenarchaeota archaeon]|nr:MAG: acyltransferase [Thermoproteota archaeon]